MLDEDPTLECTNLFQHSLLAMPAAPVSTVACDLAWRWFDVISYRGSQPPSFVDVARARIPYLRGLKLANDKTGSTYLLSKAWGRIGGYHSAPTGAKRRIYDRPAKDYALDPRGLLLPRGSSRCVGQDARTLAILGKSPCVRLTAEPPI